MTANSEREKALADFKTKVFYHLQNTLYSLRRVLICSREVKLLEHREWDAKLKNLRAELKDLQKEFDHTEDNIKALQSVGQIIGEVLKQLDDERCALGP